MKSLTFFIFRYMPVVLYRLTQLIFWSLWYFKIPREVYFSWYRYYYNDRRKARYYLTTRKIWRIIFMCPGWRPREYHYPHMEKRSYPYAGIVTRCEWHGDIPKDKLVFNF